MRRYRRDDRFGEAQRGAQPCLVRASGAGEHERLVRREGVEQPLVEHEAVGGQVEPDGVLDAPVAGRGATEQGHIAAKRRTGHLEDVVQGRVERERGVEPGGHLIERLVEMLPSTRALEQARAREVERQFRPLACRHVFVGDHDAM